MAKKMRRGQKQCPKCSAWVKGTRAKACPKCDYQFNGKQAPAPASVPAAPAKAAAPAGTIALEHVKAVARTVQAVGGFDRLNDLLVVIREVGGLKKFKDLSEAMSATDVVKF